MLPPSDDAGPWAMTPEHLLAVVNDPRVPEVGRLTLVAGPLELSIAKPYRDADGDLLGTSILVDPGTGSMAYLTVVDGEAAAFVREHGDAPFLPLGPESPAGLAALARAGWLAATGLVLGSATDGEFPEPPLPWEDLDEQFEERPVPQLLRALHAVEFRLGAGSFADGFALAAPGDAGLRTWSEDTRFLEGVVEFATANGSGSTYALWLAAGEPPEQSPVVIFGDEGGTHVVAEHLAAFLLLLAADTEASVDHDGVTFFWEEALAEEAPSPNRDAYRRWLGTVLPPEAVDPGLPAPEEILAAAQNRFGRHYADWISGIQTDGDGERPD